MIYIKEIPEGENSVTIQIDGFLEPESVPLFKEVCRRNLGEKSTVILNLEKLLYISREAMNYLEEIRRKVIIIGG